MKIFKAGWLFEDLCRGDTAIAGGHRYNIDVSTLLGYSYNERFFFESPQYRFFIIEPAFPEPAWIRVLPPGEALGIYKKLRIRRWPLWKVFPPGTQDYPAAVGRIVFHDNVRPNRPGWLPADAGIPVGGATYRAGDLEMLAHNWPIFASDRLFEPHTFLLKANVAFGKAHYVRADYDPQTGTVQVTELRGRDVQTLYEQLPWKVCSFYKAFGWRPKEA